MSFVNFSFGMQRRGWSTHLLRKLQPALLMVAVQTGLTAVAPHVGSQSQFLLWIVLCSVALIFAIFFVDSLGFLRIMDTPHSGGRCLAVSRPNTPADHCRHPCNCGAGGGHFVQLPG